MQGFIYKITNLINNKVYIGQTMQKPLDRWYRHCQKSNLSDAEKNMAIKKAIFKYGKDNFKFEVIETINDCSRTLLNEREIYWISQYDSYNNGYNCTLGGNAGVKPFKIPKSEHKNIIDLYNTGLSIRDIAKEYCVDKGTIKQILDINNIKLRKTKSYKFCQQDRENILNFYVSVLDTYGVKLSRLLTMNRFKLSRSYLSQLISGARRI